MTVPFVSFLRAHLKINIIVIFFLGIFSAGAFAQMSYEAGYYIDNAGEKVEGFIKNVDWKRNPKDFSFKKSLSESPRTLFIEDVQAFEVIDQIKYIRRLILVDKSTDYRYQLNDSMVPENEYDEVFLRVIVEGNASLYELRTNYNTRFYVSVNGSTVEQLEFKRFKIDNHDIETNDAYQDQLYELIVCSSIDEDRFFSLEYTRSVLEDFFIEMNTCLGSSSKRYIVQKRERYNIMIGPRLVYNSLYINDSNAHRSYDFGKSMSISFSAELELFLPYYNNRMAFFIGVSHLEFEFEHTADFGYASIKHRSISVPAGLRLSYYLSEKSRLFLQAGASYTFKNNTYFKSDYRNNITETTPVWNVLIGSGIVISDQINVQVNVEPWKEFFMVIRTMDLDYTSVSLTTSYHLPF